MGVFTYARAKEFRKPQAARQKDVSLSKLTEGVNATMKALLYDQIKSLILKAEMRMSRACVAIAEKVHSR